MLATLVLVLREVLEAALIISVVAASTRSVAGSRSWIGMGIVVGILGALVVAAFASAISGAMSGMGEEWFHAIVLLGATAMISWHVIWMARHGRELTAQMRTVGAQVSAGSKPLMALLIVVSLAVLREGSEIVLFGYGLLASGSTASAMALGGVLGLVIGVAMGLTLYYGLLRIPLRHFFSATNALLVLLAAGLASSAARKLVQADALPALVDRMWDTSWLISNESVLGKTLQILIGYSAHPSGMQVVFYVTTIVLLLIGMRAVRSAPPIVAPSHQATA